MLAVMCLCTWKPQGRLSCSSCIFLQDLCIFFHSLSHLVIILSAVWTVSLPHVNWWKNLTHSVGFLNKDGFIFVVISSGFNTKFWVVHQPKMPHLPMAQPPCCFRPYLSSWQVCQEDNSKGSRRDLLYHRPVTPVGASESISLALLLNVWSKVPFGIMFCGPALTNSLFYCPLWCGCRHTWVTHNAFYSSNFISSSLLAQLTPDCFQWNLFFCLFCQLFDNMCPIVSLSYSQTAPNTCCLAVTEQFDPSPCVVIGGSGLVIHGPFDCWHVKCLVPIPKAESWCARSFVFSCLTSDPRTITGSSRIFKQQQQQLRLAHLAAAWVMCGPRPPSEMGKNYSIKYSKWFPQISGLSSVSPVCLLLSNVLRSFLFFFEAQRCS